MFISCLTSYFYPKDCSLTGTLDRKEEGEEVSMTAKWLAGLTTLIAAALYPGCMFHASVSKLHPCLNCGWGILQLFKLNDFIPFRYTTKQPSGNAVLVSHGVMDYDFIILKFQFCSPIVRGVILQTINQSYYYSTNISGVARPSCTTAELVFSETDETVL